MTPAIPLVCALLVVTDGDTIKCDGEALRLMGWDSPENHRAKCESELFRAQAAKERLTSLVGGLNLDGGLNGTKHRVTIQRSRKDRYGRTLARIYIDGEDVAQIMIREGHGREYHGRGKRQGWCPG